MCFNNTIYQVPLKYLNFQRTQIFNFENYKKKLNGNF